MIKAILNEEKSLVETNGNILSLTAELLAISPVVISSVFKRLKMPEDMEKDIVRMIIDDLEEKFLENKRA